MILFVNFSLKKYYFPFLFYLKCRNPNPCCFTIQRESVYLKCPSVFFDKLKYEIRNKVLILSVYLKRHSFFFDKLKYEIRNKVLILSVYLKCHSVFLINWNAKLDIKFWFSFLCWSWDIKHKSKWFFDFQNNWDLKFKFEVRFPFFIFIWKIKK